MTDAGPVPAAEPETGALRPRPPASREPQAPYPRQRAPRREPEEGGYALRRGSADPVKELLRRHRVLCARAVDSLEIAAGLEAHGVTDRAAARYRHRDVFSLAEEMYARGARDEGPARARGTSPARARCDHPEAAPAAPRTPPAHPLWALIALLPGAVCALTVAGLRLTEGRAHLTVLLLGPLATALALCLALRHGPLRATRRTPPGVGAWTCWLTGYAAFGDELLRQALSGGPDGGWPLTTAPVLGLTLAVFPATACARLFAARAARRVGGSRDLAEFAACLRPVLIAVLILFLCALTALLAASAAVLGEHTALAGAAALGALLMLGRLLMVHGFTRAPLLMLRAAGTAEVGTLAVVFIGRLPHCSGVAAPVRSLVAACGSGVVPAAACGIAALVLLGHAVRTLPRASAHVTAGLP